MQNGFGKLIMPNHISFRSILLLFIQNGFSKFAVEINR